MLYVQRHSKWANGVGSTSAMIWVRLSHPVRLLPAAASERPGSSGGVMQMSQMHCRISSSTSHLLADSQKTF